MADDNWRSKKLLRLAGGLQSYTHGTHALVTVTVRRNDARTLSGGKHVFELTVMNDELSVGHEDQSQ
jgi:hypothetical protein